MSFSKAWKNIQDRNFAFEQSRDPDATVHWVMTRTFDALRDAQEGLLLGDSLSDTLSPYSFVEERLAAVLVGLMQVASMQGYRIPEAMALRNTKIRNAWLANNQIDTPHGSVKASVNEDKLSQSQGSPRLPRGR